MTKLLFILLIIISFTPITGQANQNDSIRIDRIKLSTNVQSVNGTLEENALAMDKSVINQGSELCSDGNAYLTGHSSPTKRRQPAGRVFANLHRVRRGDVVRAANCKYEVKSIKVITGVANRDGFTYSFDLKDWDYVVGNTFEEGTLTIQTCTRKLGQILVIKAIKL